MVFNRKYVIGMGGEDQQGIAALNAIPILVGKCERDLTLTFANRAFLEACDLSEEEALGSSLEDLFPQTLYHEIRRRLDVDGTSKFRLEIGGAPNGWETILVTVTPERHVGVERCGFHFSVAEVPLASSADEMILSEMFQRIFHHGPLGITMVDSEFRYIAVNQRFCEMLGFDGAEIVGKTFLDFTHADDRDADDAQSRRTFFGELEYFTIEKRYIRKNGEVLHAQITASTIPGESGEPRVGIGLVEDVTEKKVTEQSLHRSMRLGAIGELTGGVAHDFNNLLSIICSNLELALEELQEEKVALAKVEKFIEPAVATVERGAALTRRLLSFARRQALVPEVLDLNIVLAESDELIRRTLEEHFEIEVIRSGGLWLCEADPSQVENALLNLVINARDAMPEGGRLTLETANVVLDEDYARSRSEVIPGQYVLLAVTDTGVGMSSELVERAVEPFYATKEAGQGNGLGLSMVYGFVKQSNGHFAIYSEEGVGTTVKIYLPRTRQQRHERPGAPSEEILHDGSKKTVLVVEDDEMLGEVTVEMLRGLGYQPFLANDGPSALQALEDLPSIDLLLSDVILPGGMNGRQLSVELLRVSPKTRVLYMSGYTENAIVHHGRLDEGAYLLQKPFRRATLARMIARVFEET